MSITLNINGTDYEYPETNDQRWGPDATGWAQAVTNGMLQKEGGLFQLLAEVDFGTSFGLKSIYYKSRATNPSSTGILRLGNTELVGWRNQLNNADITLAVNSSNQFVLGGSILPGTNATFDLGSGSFQWRDGKFSRNVDVGGDLAVTGAISAGSFLVTGLTVNGNTVLGDTSADTITLNGTITSHLIATDNTYDIGASGATRFRDLFLARNAVIGGTFTLGGLVTSHLLATDNTYDIGASGATRFRNLYLAGNAFIGGELGVIGATTFDGNVTLGNATTDAIIPTGQVQGDLLPITDSLYDLGSSAKQWAEIHVDSFLPDLILAGDGSAASPSYSFESDPNSGFYSIGGDNIGLSLGGALRVNFGGVDSMIALGANKQVGVGQQGIVASWTASSGATSFANGFVSTISSAAAAFTLDKLSQFTASLVTVGAGSTINYVVDYLSIGANGGGTGNANFSTITNPPGNFFIYSTSTSDSFLSGHLRIGTQKELRLEDTTGGEYVGLRASGTQTTYTITLPAAAPATNAALSYNGSAYVWSTSFNGDVVGPASATDGAIALYDGTTGKLLKNSTLTVSGSDLTVAGAANFNGNVTLGNAAADNITVTGTITSNVIATDNTYDIGASGATRFRDLFLARNAVIGGTLQSVGIHTAAGITLNGGSAADLSIWSASNVLRLRGGSSGFAFDGTSTSGIFTISDASVGRFNGQFGIQAAPSSSDQVRVVNSGLTGTSIFGVNSNISAPSTATSQVYAFVAQAATSASSFTSGTVAGVFSTVTAGSTSTITRAMGYYFAGFTATGTITNQATIGDNTAFTGNWFINSTNTNPSQFAGLVGVKQATDNVTDALPTQAEMVTALGAANQGTGMIGVIKDNNADTNFFICISNGTSWYALKMTKGA